MACGSDDGRVFLYDAGSGQPLLSIEADEDVANCVQVNMLVSSVLPCVLTVYCRAIRVCRCWRRVA